MQSPVLFAVDPDPPQTVIVIVIVIVIAALWDEIVATRGPEALTRVAGMKLASPSVSRRTGVPLGVVTTVNGVVQCTPLGNIAAAWGASPLDPTKM